MGREPISHEGTDAFASGASAAKAEEHSGDSTKSDDSRESVATTFELHKGTQERRLTKQGQSTGAETASWGGARSSPQPWPSS